MSMPPSNTSNHLVPSLDYHKTVPRKTKHRCFPAAQLESQTVLLTHSIEHGMIKKFVMLKVA
jgi:hypothetical protein